MLFAWGCLPGTTRTWSATVPIPMGPERPRWHDPPLQSTVSAMTTVHLSQAQHMTREKEEREEQLSSEDGISWPQMMTLSLMQGSVNVERSREPPSTTPTTPHNQVESPGYLEPEIFHSDQEQTALVEHQVDSPVYLEPEIFNSDQEQTALVEPMRTKRSRYTRVQMSAMGENGTTRGQTTSLLVPVTERAICLRLDITQVEGDETTATGASASTASRPLTRPPQPSSNALTQEPMRLPKPAPGGLDRHGISWRDLVTMWKRLNKGEMTMPHIAQQHGQEVANYLQAHREMLGELLADDCAKQVDATGEPNAEQEEVDETGLFSLPTLFMLPGLIIRSNGQADAEPDFMQVGYRIISRWRDRGLSLQSAANFLLSLAEERDDGEYMEDYAQHLQQLGLPAEARENSVELQDEQRDVLIWLEAELWLNWIDFLEGSSGWESEAVRANRARTHGLDPRDMRGWRDWADALAFPREPTSRPPGPEASDDTRSTRTRRSETGEEARASGSRRSHSRERGSTSTRTDTRGTLPRHTRSRSWARCTTETRRLLPRHMESQGNRGRGEGGERMQPAEATARWLYILGFRSSFHGQELQPALPGGRDSYDRDEHIAHIHPQDVAAMQQGMLRVLAMLMIECSQLLMRHPTLQPPRDRDNDDHLLMQTHLTKRGKDEKTRWEEEITEMDREEQLVREEAEAKQKQQEEEEAWTEQCMQEEDAAALRLWEQHQAQRYREWEQWTVMHATPGEGTKKRLRITTQRGAQLQQTEMDVAVGAEISIHLGPISAGTSPQSSWETPHVSVDNLLSNMYKLWKEGKIDDTVVQHIAGIETLGLYNAQLLQEVDTKDTLHETNSQGSESEKGHN